MRSEVADGLKNMLTVSELADAYQVSSRTAQRWARDLLDAPKATPEQVLALLELQRLRGIPPTGVLLIPRADLARLEALRKPVGYPKDKKRERKGQLGAS